jgi:hypothetical protein
MFSVLSFDCKLSGVNPKVLFFVVESLTLQHICFELI